MVTPDVSLQARCGPHMPGIKVCRPEEEIQLLQA